MRARARIRVKVSTKIPVALLRRQLPDAAPLWGECLFLLDPDAQDYDWLVAIDDLAPARGERRSRRIERVRCPPEHTLLVTTEPACIKSYGRRFTAQFAHVLTSQERWALPHPGRIHSQCGLVWIYGYSFGTGRARSFDALCRQPPPTKSASVSMVWSRKAERHTFHHRRQRLMRYLCDAVPELRLYGGGLRPLDDKAEAIDPHAYHVVIENHIAHHHWSEKLADAFLGHALPFYCGCPNVGEYFPAESLIPIPADRPDEAATIIRASLAAGEHRRRAEAVAEARRLVLYEHNLFALLARIVSAHHAPGRRPAPGHVLLARRALRHRHPGAALQDLIDKTRARLRCSHAWSKEGAAGVEP